MNYENCFDQEQDCQQIFRSLLHALSNPGEIQNIFQFTKEIKDPSGVIVSLAMTLLDKETSFSLIGAPELSEDISQMTYAKVLHEAGADFIFVMKKSTLEEIEKIMALASPGTLVEPHKNTVFIVGVEAFDGSGNCVWTGPGIQSSKAVSLDIYGRQWIEQRDWMNYEYPMGIDIFFVTPGGEIMGIPRNVKMKG
ncbi:MAG: phosphonate C-P lyase system protein PhnH [Thermotaleaceae bacterium]